MVQQEDQSGSPAATGSTVPLISSSDPSPKPEPSSSLLLPKSSPRPIIAVEAPALEASENGGPSATGADHDTTPTPNNPPQDEPFRWKPLITPWTSMYRGYESRSLLEPIPSGSGNNPKMEVEEKTSQSVAWSDTLEELQEAIPFIKSLEPGYQLSSVGLLEALVLTGPARPGDKCVDDVVWVTLTFRSELKKTKTPQSKEPTVADYPIDPIIEALSMNHHWGVPFALIADEKFGVLPFSLEGPFTVLGWYHVCGVGEPTHTLDSTAKRLTVTSEWTFRFRPTSEAAGLSNGDAEALSADSSMDQEHTLGSAPLHDQQTEDTSTSEMSLGPQSHLAASAPVPRRDRSAEGPLSNSVSAMNIGSQIRASSSSTAVAMEVDPPYEALQTPGDNASVVSRGGGHRGAAPGTSPHQETDPEDASQSFGFGGYKKPYALPSQAEMYAEYANTMIRINEWGKESITSTPAVEHQASGTTTTTASQSTSQSPTRARSTHDPYGDAACVDPPSSATLSPSSTRNPTSPYQPPNRSTRNHHPSQVPEQNVPQNAQKGGIKARLMASVLEWTALRKPTREGFTLKSSVAETTGSEPAAMEESPPQPPQTAEGQNSLSESSDLDGIPLEEPSPPRSPPLPPSPPPGAEEPVTGAIVSTVNAAPSKGTQSKPAPWLRKGKARSKHERPIFGPPKPQDLPEFPHLGPPPTADAPISPEELGLSFDRRELDPNSTTQWDIIATKLDGFHRTDLPRPKWAWHTLTLGDPAVMPEFGRDDGDYYKGFTMGRVLWNDGVEAITYVGEADDRLKIVHVKTTKSLLRDPLENLIAESADLKSLIRPRFAQGRGAGNLAPYFAHLVGDGDLEIHPELKPTPFEEIYDRDCILEKIDTFMGQCTAHTCLSTDTGPFDQQVLLLGGADAPAITEAFCKDTMIAFTVIGAACDLTVKSVNSWKTEKGRKEHDFFASIDMLHGDFVCVTAPTALKYSLERKGFGLVALGRWIHAKPDEGD
ncbi:hypothetical protein FRC04_002493 [Tulasnella sp. 424]|nr:hypothetical protein FRC04_002493 [Tulasnella sp. 424]